MDEVPLDTEAGVTGTSVLRVVLQSNVLELLLILVEPAGLEDTRKTLCDSDWYRCGLIVILCPYLPRRNRW